MRFTTVVTSKGQITVPKQVRGMINFKPDVKVDFCLTVDGFIGHLHKPSKIFDFLGDLKYLYKKKPLAEARREARRPTGPS